VFFFITIFDKFFNLMKESNFLKWGSFVCMMFLAFVQAFAQAPVPAPAPPAAFPVVNMPLNPAAPVAVQNFSAGAVCGYNFFDNGGSAAAYSNSSGALSIQTFSPSSPAKKVRVTFASHASEPGFDALYIHNGNSVAAALFAGTAGGIGGAGGWNTTPPTFTSTAADGSLTFRFRSDVSVTGAGWVSVVTEVSATPPVMNAPAVANFNTSALPGNQPFTANIPVPTYTGTSHLNGAGNAAFHLRYTVNGVQFFNYTVGMALPAAATVPLAPGLTCGANLVVWELLDPCSQQVVASTSSTVNIVDNTKPVVVCPANTTINLPAGDCNVSYGYLVTATDNCPFLGPNTQSQVHGSSASNSNQFATITFGLRNDGTVPIKVTGVNANLGDFPGPGFVGNVDAKLFLGPINGAGGLTGTAAIGTWTPTATQTVAVNVTSYFQTTLIPLAAADQFILQPGEVRGIAVQSTSGNFMRYANGNETSTNGTVSIISNGHFAGGAVATLGNTPRLFKGSVQYQATLPAPPVVQTSGLPSGAFFPIGVTTNCFAATDAAMPVGNTGTCCFNVTVNAFQGAITALVCNDHVQLSLDEDCSVCMNADQVLEGGPYHCYDDYAVEIKKGNQWVPACLANADVNKTYEVRVRDLKTPFNTCWGEVKVEDKLAPKITCYPITVACNATPPTEPAPAVVGLQTYQVTGLNDLIDDAPTSPQMRSYLFNVPLAATTTVSDVNVIVNLESTWTMDVQINLTSPSGLTRNVFQVGGCAGTFPVNVTFDDQGTGGLTACAALNAPGTNIQCVVLPGVQNPAQLAPFNGLLAAGTWKIDIVDIFNDDACAGGCVTVHGVGVQLNVNQPAAPPTDNCMLMTNGVTYSDQLSDNGCAGAVINRTWVAKDKSGNSASCVQVITFTPAKLSDVTRPPNYDGISAPFFNCSIGSYPTPDYIESLGLAGFPHINGSAAQGFCDINWAYDDLVIDVCDGTYKILRKWSVLDWCTGAILEFNQVVKVVDNSGPAIEVDADVTTPGVQAPGLLPINNFGVPAANAVATVILSTDYYQCCSKENAPALIVSDDCSSVVSASVSTPIGNLAGQVSQLATWPVTYQVTFPNGGALCFPVGTHTFTYTVKDQCGNTSTKTQRVIVRDYTPPVAICQQKTTVAVGSDDPYDCYPANGIPTAANEGGIVWVPATAFNDGSYDNCQNILLTVRRMAPYSDCINQLNPQDGDPYCDPNDFQFDLVSEYATAINENDSIKFYCCEVGTTQMVILRVYELDANDNFVLGPDNQPIYNECMVEIDVQDKIKPFCQAPANKSVNCDEFDPLVWYGNLTYGDNCCISDLDTSITYVPNQIAFEQCNYGQVRRTFVVKDCNNNSSRCTQTITVNYKEQYRVYFPDDKNLTVCNTLNANEEPAIYGENCELIGISHEDVIFNVVPDACYKILRTFTIINWCTYNPNLGNVNIPNSNTSTQGARVWIGEGGLVDWAAYNPNSPETPTVAAKMWSYPAPLTGTAANQEGTPSYSYTQVIKVQDATPPQANIDPQLGTANYTFCDYSTNDPLQWNQDAGYNPYNLTNTWSPACLSHDLCEGVVDLSILATDACSDDNLNFRYLLFLDLDGDGVMETTINSEATATAANHFNYGFGLNETDKVTINGVKYLKGVVTRDFESDDPDHTKYAAFALPYGAHKIKWIVEDRCGNDFTKEYNIIVKDCKNPTVVCLNGLAVNGMNAAVGTTPAGVTLWATDFLKYAEDNCTDASQLVYAIRDEDINPGTGFPLDGNGQPQTNLTWGCSQIGTNPVQLWAKDKAGNADYCWSYLILSDNTNACTGPTAKIAGDIKTNNQFSTNNAYGVAEIKVDVTANAVGLPDISKVFNTGDNGHYDFTALPIAGSAMVVPTKDVNPTNGVNMFDVVRMSKHVLNIEPFTTGYQYLAADINNNKVVTTSDIVELRKLILGIYTDFPANTSWRFVEKSFGFDMNTNPLTQGYKEFIQVAALQTLNMDNHFVGVKVGDLTDDAITNNVTTVDDRTNGTLLFSVNEKEVVAGEEFTVTFKANELVSASQFTLTFNGLTALEIVAGAGTSAEYFALFANDNAITAAIDSKIASEFSVKFRADKAGSLSSMLGVSNRITKAVAFKNDDRLDVALQFHNGSVTTISGVGFELYQNQPNPFVEKTFIGFNLPEATTATLTVYDAQGKALTTQKGQFNKGFNQVAIDRASLKGAGLVYYTLETATETATRKMIMMD
jgi:hypothetical protein